jgi:hypothetical protein
VVNEPTAATTGIGTYTVLAIAASVLAVTYRRAG